MLNWLRQLFGKAGEPTSSSTGDDPIYGLPRHSVEQWLARNPRIREEYDAELRRRKLNGWSAAGEQPRAAPRS